MRVGLVSLAMLLSCTSAKTERWTSFTIDGRAAPGFVMELRNGQVVGGHDRCNGWGLSDQPGLITIDAQECRPDPMRDAYWALARGEGSSFSRQGDRLIVRAGDHVGVFVGA